MHGGVALKVCGVTRAEDLEFIDGVADYVGFIASLARPKDSPRALSIEKAIDLASTVARSRRVLVLFDVDLKGALELASSLEAFDVIQYHKPLEPRAAMSMAEELKSLGLSLAPVTLWNGRRLEPHPCTIPSHDYEYLLVDALKGLNRRYEGGLKAPLRSYVEALKCHRKVGAAGGVSESNVCLVMKLRVSLVDVSSSVEEAPGVKSRVKVERLVEAMRRCV
ncbi:MAG: hypothetical protein F7B17_01790 [Desulfurococcales archaeon]|nr:hypothetical protein [Desulfurococcales archaeon]